MNETKPHDSQNILSPEFLPKCRYALFFPMSMIIKQKNFSFIFAFINISFLDMQRGAFYKLKMTVCEILSPKTPAEYEHQSIQKEKNRPNITGFQPVLNKL